MIVKYPEDLKSIQILQFGDRFYKYCRVCAEPLQNLFLSEMNHMGRFFSNRKVTVFVLASGFLRTCFRDSSGVLREIPKVSERNPEEIPKKSLK
jgi:hypothetical protein